MVLCATKVTALRRKNKRAVALSTLMIWIASVLVNADGPGHIDTSRFDILWSDEEVSKIDQHLTLLTLPPKTGTLQR